MQCQGQNGNGAGAIAHECKPSKTESTFWQKGSGKSSGASAKKVQRMQREPCLPNLSGMQGKQITEGHAWWNYRVEGIINSGADITIIGAELFKKATSCLHEEVSISEARQGALYLQPPTVPAGC